MRIDKIILYNFGSYEGETVFDTSTAENGKNIILVGGKNGAGKTTLFTAMRLCLYGYMSMGYKNANAFYNRAVTKLINNKAKLNRPTSAHVEMDIALSNGRELDNYTLRRSWQLKESTAETFSISKNSVPLSSEEVADFEKYLLSLIPPELFNLYFFDGEKIADFFLDEGGNSRIKNAFLTLCGYDTFDIMRRNFKRISSGDSNTSPALDEYLAAKEAAADAQHTYQDLLVRLQQCVDDMDSCNADISALEKEYQQKGGITQEEWNQKLLTLKEEDRKRENYNALLRKWANDVVPFLMIRDQIERLRAQIDKEANAQKYRNFCEVLEIPAVQALLRGRLDEVKTAAAKEFDNGSAAILDLSLEQSALLISQIIQILDFEPDKVEKCKKAIQKSIALSAKTRQELDNSNVSSVQEYMQKRSQLFEAKSSMLMQRIELEQQISEHKEKTQQAESQLTRVQSRLEEDLKKASISDISARAIVMLDKLQQTLYRRQIKKVEDFFREEIKILMRKTRFIDDIHIDDNFNVHIYKSEEIQTDKLREVFSSNSDSQITAMLGSSAANKLMELLGTNHWEETRFLIASSTIPTFILPIELDKTSLSNGEKQIFIMALYHSLVRLCAHEIPFIIDTPFARIDTEHRRNISEHFFSKLNGQVFILSTNEEINSAHVQIMKEKIAATYMLENTDNSRTVVVSDKYFEV